MALACPRTPTLPTDAWRHIADFLTPVELFRFGCTSREFHGLRREALPPLVRRRIAALLLRMGLKLPAPWPRGLRLSGSLVYHALTQDAGAPWQPGAPNFYVARVVEPVYPPGQYALAHTPAVGESAQTGSCCAGHPSAPQRVAAWLGTKGLVYVASDEENAYKHTPTLSTLYFMPSGGLEGHHHSRALPSLRRLWLQVHLGVELPQGLRVMHCNCTHRASLQLTVVAKETRPQFDLPVLENFFDGHGLYVTHPEDLLANESRYRWLYTAREEGATAWWERCQRLAVARVALYRNRGLRVLDAGGPVGTRGHKRRAE